MLMNENSELRSLLRLSKNFSKNIINKSIKNNIVLINNDGGVKTKRKHRGFIPSTFGVTLSYTKFTLPINTYSLIYFFNIISSFTPYYILFLIIICSLIYIVYLILICIFSFTIVYILSYICIRLFSFIVDYSFSYISSRIVIYAPYYSFIKISNSIPINISFSSSFISFIYISFISFIIFTSFTDLFISDNTVITI